MDSSAGVPPSQVQYRGERHSGSGGHNNLIELDSVEAQIIADDQEAGLTVRHATAHVNEHRAECDPPNIHFERSKLCCAWTPPSTRSSHRGAGSRGTPPCTPDRFEGRTVGDRPELNCWD